MIFYDFIKEDKLMKDFIYKKMDDFDFTYEERQISFKEGA